MAATVLRMIALVFLASSTFVTALEESGGQRARCAKACNSLLNEARLNVTNNAQDAVYWAKQTTLIQPACYVHARTTREVAVVVKSSQSNNCPIAIRGGGHSDVPGASNIADGITLNLAAFQQVKLNKTETSASLGAGLNWGKVYSTLDPLGYTAIGGRESSVGVAGLTLGGGISYLSGLHGFACDNIRSYEVVLANGATVHARPNSKYADLYRALRGGGNNFGVVTSFDVDVYPQGLFNGGLIGWSDSSSTEQGVVDAFTKFAKNAPSDPEASVFTAVQYDSKTKSFPWIAGLTYAKPVANPDIFAPFYTKALNTSRTFSTIRNAPHANLTDELGSTQPPGLREQFHTATYRLDSRLQSAIAKIFREEIARVKAGLKDKSSSVGAAVAFQAFTKPFLAQQAKRGGNVLGLSPDEAPLMILSMAWTWVNPADDKIVISGMQNVVDRSVEVSKKMGLFDRYIYMNYAAPGQDPVKSYGPENVAFLNQVSKKYDPNGVFQNLVPGGFKLSGNA